ncbi:THC0290_0291 family protein [Christiangramia forsetii]|uniref:Secreted protein n=2 Tax=Christiangramia forsetii TaxID=411153 RepID=A0M686_CHRFK|nr:glutamate dehydrogenase [Christiangramia forsetii]GGG31103.1 glutamate dehydrogenase [Christiangramia forsetii]CAL68131.1 secreted protein [Christiangramia forsetii KT0803]
MINTRAIFVLILVLSLWSGKAFGQLSISNELGIITGPAGFFTDYGERYNLRNNLENEGFGVGLVHYINFAFKGECSCRPTKLWFTKHFRIRNEIDYLQSKLDHYGPIAQKNTESGRQLRAMHGKTQVIEAGTSLEYHLFGIREARDFAVLFAPYISLGVHYVHYKPSAFSELGPLDSPKVLFPTFEDGLFLEDGNTFAILGSAGLRYRLGRFNDLQIEARAIYYDTDKLEGLDVQGPQNKFNDFVLWFNIGYIYYLDF